MIYRLHLESGPKKRKTMAHVSNLVGCCVGGPTTDETLEATPDAIRRYLGFLAAHGEPVAPSAPFDLEIVEHVTEGAWIGNGVAVIATDTDPLPPKERDMLLTRYRWIHEALLDEIEGLGSEELTTKPERGRAIGHIVAHVVQADGAYLSSGLRGNRELNRVAREVERGELDPRDGLRTVGDLFVSDVRAATPAERRAVIPTASRSARSVGRCAERSSTAGSICRRSR